MTGLISHPVTGCVECNSNSGCFTIQNLSSLFMQVLQWTTATSDFYSQHIPNLIEWVQEYISMLGLATLTDWCRFFGKKTSTVGVWPRQKRTSCNFHVHILPMFRILVWTVGPWNTASPVWGTTKPTTLAEVIQYHSLRVKQENLKLMMHIMFTPRQLGSSGMPCHSDWHCFLS